MILFSVGVGTLLFCVTATFVLSDWSDPKFSTGGYVFQKYSTGSIDELELMKETAQVLLNDWDRRLKERNPES
jgi:hypothetical protein